MDFTDRDTEEHQQDAEVYRLLQQIQALSQDITDVKHARCRNGSGGHQKRKMDPKVKEGLNPSTNPGIDPDLNF